MFDDNYWDQMVNEDEETDEAFDTAGTYASVNGARVNITPGSSFKDTVVGLSKDAGLGKFRVHFNGSEIKPSEAPELINEGDRLDIRPYDVAG
jgi:hypothetical protein